MRDLPGADIPVIQVLLSDRYRHLLMYFDPVFSLSVQRQGRSAQTAYRILFCCCHSPAELLNVWLKRT